MVNVDTKIRRVGISLPSKILSKIDAERGDISRSRYLLRIIEKRYTKDLNAF